MISIFGYFVMCFYFLLVFFNIKRFNLFYFSFGFSSILVLILFPFSNCRAST